MAKGNAGPGVYSATYSNIPVYEFQFGPDLKEHVMRRRHDDYINATHILKACGFDKPARTRILEREVQKGTHEKVQGGYGKYQGTWVPLESGRALAVQNNVYEKLKMIFEYTPGDDSPPPAPKHTTNKPKVVKKPSVPKFSMPVPRAQSPDPMLYDNASNHMDEDETPDNTTVASASYFDDEDHEGFPMSQASTGHRKRKYSPQPTPRSVQEQNHMVYADELLDYFLISQKSEPAARPELRPEPPVNFLPEFPIDNESNTALHWACAMGDVEVMRELRRHGASITARNLRGETALMRAVYFTNCRDKQSMPRILNELFTTINMIDSYGSSAIHHAALMCQSRSKHQCARYYLEVLCNKMYEELNPDEFQRLLDLQDGEGNTACHLAARFKARKCVRALIGRGASTNLRNNEGITAEELIQELNSSRRERNLAASSSPFGPDSHNRITFQEPQSMVDISRHTTAHHSEAAMTVESKVTPLVVEKFQQLAHSFDEELIEKDKSEKEAKRILKQTELEIAQVRERIAVLDAEEEDEEERIAEEAELARLTTSIISLVEQQQAINLSAHVQRQEAIHNGANINGNGVHNDSVDVRLDLFNQLQEQQARRRALVEEYVEALGMAGMGEKGEMYRKLTARVLGMSEEEVDGQLDGLLEALEESKGEGAGGLVVD